MRRRNRVKLTFSLFLRSPANRKVSTRTVRRRPSFTSLACIGRRTERNYRNSSGSTAPLPMVPPASQLLFAYQLLLLLPADGVVVTHTHTHTVKLIVDHFSGRSRGFAFVSFATSEDATAARDAMNSAVRTCILLACLRSPFSTLDALLVVATGCRWPTDLCQEGDGRGRWGRQRGRRLRGQRRLLWLRRLVGRGSRPHLGV